MMLRISAHALNHRTARHTRRGALCCTTLVTQSPPWEKDRLAGIRVLLRSIADRKPVAPDQTLGRWTWRLARAARKALDRKASGEMPEAKRLLGALANSRGHRHEENAARLVNVALEQPVAVGV